ncbi:MAG TPA: tryptophan 7-halogenase, partial [Polyangiaceae bacterium]|nr:tryptophan 7-halogenase [Polyangiaceae bacterium]
AKRFNLREEPPPLKTNTRSIFGHFTNVPPLDDVLGGLGPMFRFRRNAGTMHHCFPGGWVWVIPFDNDVTSVGFEFDRDMYPLDESISAEEELKRFLARFPSIQAHLGNMQPVRPLIRADRIQFTSKQIVGDGFILAPHAAAFIEPLFSTGIVLTLAFVARLAPALKAAAAANDFSKERFLDMERAFFAEIRQIDLLVNGVIQSFRDYDLFKQYWRNWVVGTLAQFGTSILVDGATQTRPMLYGSGLEGFPEALERMHEMVCKKGGDDKALARELEPMIDYWFDRVCRPVLTTSGDFSVESAQSCAVLGATDSAPVVEWMHKLVADYSTHQPGVRFENAEKWFAYLGEKLARQLERYRTSRRDGTDFHKAYERIILNQNPANFDYHSYIGLEQPE